ncbi:unnamed protein product [Rodentolepis nana]|uniref:GNAT family N-acetyltransferase n=1 Tax=Rodentolepis nana TaxID=102285 RepID=A0A0R3TFS9_RODNA|nr:unnamed protein product [Rodentolepis nana]
MGHIEVERYSFLEIHSIASRSVVNGWIQTFESLEAEAKAHQDIAEKISTKLLPTSKNFIAVVDRDIKPVGMNFKV